MKLPRKIVETVEVQSVMVTLKVCDSGCYELKDSNFKTIAEREDYVPKFFPGEHYGDYIMLDIDLETGQIRNWKKPSPQLVSECFNLITEDE